MNPVLAHAAYLGAIVVAVFALAAAGWLYARNVFRAGDKLVASLFGFDGYRTLSAECGKSGCVFCKTLCWLLALRWEAHCAKAAKEEGLLA